MVSNKNNTTTTVLSNKKKAKPGTHRKPPKTTTATVAIQDPLKSNVNRNQGEDEEEYDLNEAIKSFKIKRKQKKRTT